MTCGACTQSRPDADQLRRARAILCHWCSRAEHDTGPWDGSAITCTISGRPIAEHVRSCRPSCPRGKHPEENGLVRWAGIVWYGVPMPLRVLSRRMLTGPLPGCGCVKALKDRWLRIRGWFGPPASPTIQE